MDWEETLDRDHGEWSYDQSQVRGHVYQQYSSKYFTYQNLNNHIIRAYHLSYFVILFYPKNENEKKDYKWSHGLQSGRNNYFTHFCFPPEGKRSWSLPLTDHAPS